MNGMNLNFLNKCHVVSPSFDVPFLSIISSSPTHNGGTAFILCLKKMTLVLHHDNLNMSSIISRGRRGRDRMVVGFW